MEDKEKFIEICKQILLLLLNWPFQCSTPKPLFSEKMITLLQDTSESMETMRTRKNVAVISGSSAGIIGGGLSIAGSVLFFFPGIGTAVGLGLLIPGIVIGTSGSGISSGFSIAKFFVDRKKKKSIKNCLEKFVKCLHEAATAFVKANIALTIINTMENYPNNSNDDLKALLDQVKKRKQKIEREIANPSVDAFFQIKCVKKHVDKMLDTLVKKKILVTGPTETDYDDNKVKENIDQATKAPFDELESAICGLAEYRDDKRKTFLTFVLKMFEEKKELEDINEENPLSDKIESDEGLLKGLITACNGVNGTTTVTVAGASGLTARKMVQIAAKGGRAIEETCQVVQKVANIVAKGGKAVEETCQAAQKGVNSCKSAAEAVKSVALTSKAGMKSAAIAVTPTNVTSAVQSVSEVTASLGTSTAGAVKSCQSAAEAGKGVAHASKAGMKSAAVATTPATSAVQSVSEVTASLGSSTAGAAEATKNVTSAATNIGKVTKGIAAAGIVLSAIGIAIDLAFLGHAIYDLCQKKKADFPRLLDNTIEIMEKLNGIVIGPE